MASTERWPSEPKNLLLRLILELQIACPSSASSFVLLIIVLRKHLMLNLLFLIILRLLLKSLRGWALRPIILWHASSLTILFKLKLFGISAFSQRCSHYWMHMNPRCVARNECRTSAHWTNRLKLHQRVLGLQGILRLLLLFQVSSPELVRFCV